MVVVSIKTKKRIKFILIGAIILMTLLIMHIAYIQFIQGKELQAKAYEQQSLERAVNPKRGTIYDATGKVVLAVSSSAETVTVNPTNIAKENKEKVAKALSEILVALLGFATVIAVIVLLLRNVTVPALAFVSVSTITAAILVATGAFTLDEMAGFIKEGVKGVHGTAVLFIFSVLFFGVMTDAGMFDKIIGALMKKVGNNVVGVALMTHLH